MTPSGLSLVNQLSWSPSPTFLRDEGWLTVDDSQVGERQEGRWVREPAVEMMEAASGGVPGTEEGLLPVFIKHHNSSLR